MPTVRVAPNDRRGDKSSLMPDTKSLGLGIQRNNITLDTKTQLLEVPILLKWFRSSVCEKYNS